MPVGLAGLAVQCVVLAVLVLALRVSQSRGHKVRIVCPQGRGVVTCTLLRSHRDGHWEGVESCSAFGDGAVRCSRTCVGALNGRSAR